MILEWTLECLWSGLWSRLVDSGMPLKLGWTLEWTLESLWSGLWSDSGVALEWTLEWTLESTLE